MHSEIGHTLIQTPLGKQNEEYTRRSKQVLFIIYYSLLYLFIIFIVLLKSEGSEQHRETSLVVFLGLSITKKIV